MAEWIASGSGRWADKGIAETQRNLGRLIQVVGNRAVDEVRRDDIAKFKSLLQRVPKGTAWDTDIREFVTGDEPSPEKRPSAATVSKPIGRVGAFFAYALDREWIERNPAVGFTTRKKRAEAREDRHPFTDEDLAAIFAADFFEETVGKGQEARLWMALLALFTGARRTEIGQLRVGDLTKADGIFALQVTAEGEGKRVKNQASFRTVPIHSFLVDELGFGDFLARRRNEAKVEATLLPGVKQTYNGWGDAQSRAVIRRMRKVGITAQRKVFHSLRHMVIHRLKLAEVPVSAIQAIVGHSDDSITTGLYGTVYNTESLRGHIERLYFSGPLGPLVDHMARAAETKEK